MQIRLHIYDIYINAISITPRLQLPSLPEQPDWSLTWSLISEERFSHDAVHISSVCDLKFIAVSHAINSHVLTSTNPCINKAIHMLLMDGFAF